MAKPKKRVTKRVNQPISVSSTDSTTTSTTEIKPSIPRQTPLKPLKKSAQAAHKAARKAQAADEVLIQFGGKEISHKEILNRIRQNYKETGATDMISSLKAYVKPEESRVYYVINENITGSIDY